MTALAYLRARTLAALLTVAIGAVLLATCQAPSTGNGLVGVVTSHTTTALTVRTAPGHTHTITNPGPAAACTPGTTYPACLSH